MLLSHINFLTSSFATSMERDGDDGWSKMAVLSHIKKEVRFTNREGKGPAMGNDWDRAEKVVHDPG